MSDIFISYASDDKSRVEPLAEALEAQGWSVWWDRAIPAGREFEDVIEEAIDAARCIVVVWSDKSVSSRWVRTEADEGANRQILVPVLFDNVKIPLAFRRIQAANLIGWQRTLPHLGFDRLVKDISGLIGTPSALHSAESFPTTHAASARQRPTPVPQRPAAPLRERKQSIGLISKAIPVTLLALWLLGLIGGIGGSLIHIFLLLSLIAFIINVVRWRNRG